MQAAVLEPLSDWPADAIATIEAIALSQETFTAVDVTRELRKPPHSNMIGAAFSAARSQGLIEAAGYTTSTTPSRHHGVIRVWKRKQEGVTK